MCHRDQYHQPFAAATEQRKRSGNKHHIIWLSKKWRWQRLCLNLSQNSSWWGCAKAGGGFDCASGRWGKRRLESLQKLPSELQLHALLIPTTHLSFKGHSKPLKWTLCIVVFHAGRLRKNLISVLAQCPPLHQIRLHYEANGMEASESLICTGPFQGPGGTLAMSAF